MHVSTVEGFPDIGRSTSDDSNDIGSSTGIATIVLAIILCLVIVIVVVALALFFIQRRLVNKSAFRYQLNKLLVNKCSCFLLCVLAVV